MSYFFVVNKRSSNFGIVKIEIFSLMRYFFYPVLTGLIGLLVICAAFIGIVSTIFKNRLKTNDSPERERERKRERSKERERERNIIIIK